MKRYFIAGIGTDVGKTIISAILTETLAADYWKPVQTGSMFLTDAQKVQSLIQNTNTRIHPEVYLLEQYMSPHAAAEQSNVTIQLEAICLPETNNHLIIEGAGGLMVPLNKKDFMIDLIARFKAEVILVVQNYLGSINHTLLSIEALTHRNIPIAGLVFNGPRHPLSEEIILTHSPTQRHVFVNKEQEITKETIQKYSRAFSIFKPA